MCQKNSVDRMVFVLMCMEFDSNVNVSEEWGGIRKEKNSIDL